LLTHRLSDHLTAGLGYHFGNIDSNLALRDYQQHAFTVDLNYALTTKWNVGVGYRYWRTNADDPTQSFTQNRVILSTNYNF
jgi:opacity protein-like surface antigen